MHRRASSIFSAVFALVSLLLLLSPGILYAQTPDPPIPAGHIRIHYFRPDGNYSGWTVYAFDNTTEDTGNYGGGPVQVTGTDSFGVHFDVGITTGAQEVGIIIHNPTAAGGDQKDTPNNLFVDPSTQGIEYWAYSGIAKLYNIRAQLDQSHRASARICSRPLPPHRRQLQRLDHLRLLRHHRVSPATTTAASSRPPTPTHTESILTSPVVPNAQNLGLIIHNPSAPGGDQKDPGPNEFVDPSTEGFEYWGYTGIGKLYKSHAQPHQSQCARCPATRAFTITGPTATTPTGPVYAFDDTAEYTGDYNDGLTCVTSIRLLRRVLRHQPDSQCRRTSASSFTTPRPELKIPGRTCISMWPPNSQAWAISGNATVFTSTPTPDPDPR